VGVLVSNPPYVARDEALPAEVADWEPAGALVAGATGLEAIEQIVAGAGVWLRRPGVLVLEIAPHQADTVAVLLRSGGAGEVMIEPDLAGRQRCAVGRFTAG
jgi:release factor glutamine methyltransferase